MTQLVEKFISWKIVASAVCVILFAMAGTLWSSTHERIKILEAKIDKKVDIERYNTDVKRLEDKIDQLIIMHMANLPYKRIK